MAALIMIFYSVGAVTAVSGVLAFLLVLAERYLADYGDCNIDINAGGKNLTVKGGASLLSLLSQKKIFLPSACGGRGTCGYCKCKVLDGVGPILPTEEPLLDDEERQSNVRVACQIKVKQDVKIEIPEELFNIKEFKTTVEVLDDLTYDIKLLRLKLIDPPEINFTAGQHAQLYTKPYDNVKESINRAYSIASPSSEKNYIDFMVRLMPEGMCTTWVHKHLKVGDEVKLVGPMGEFRLHDSEDEMVMVAGGSGMAPIAALLAEIAEKKIERKVTYFCGAVTKRDLFYMDEMREFEQQIPGFTFVPALSGDVPDDEWDGVRGLITKPLDNHLKERGENTNVQAYMCGSPGMINACIGVLTKNGVQRSNIFFDPFA